MRKLVNMVGKLYADNVLVSEMTITTDFLEKIVDAMQAESGELDGYKYHHTGTGTTPATASDTTLETAVGSRVVGSQTEANSVTYRSIATISYANALSVTEWGLFDAASGGNLLDRATFVAVAVSSGQTVQWTFDLEFAEA